MAKVKYLGEKLTKRIQLPVPYLTKSDTGALITFAGPGDIQEMPDESALNLVDLAPHEFELVDPKKKS